MEPFNRFEAPESTLKPIPRRNNAKCIAAAKRLMAFHNHGDVTFSYFLRIYWKYNLFTLIFVLGVMVCAVVGVDEIRPLLIFVFAFLLGFYLRQLRYYGQIASNWWITELFTDWKKVREIADSDPNDPI